MKNAWRLVPKKRVQEAFTGEGARLGGGRWNHTGIPVVYVSETLSLAALELFVHFTRRDIKLAKSLLAIPLEIPDSLRIKAVPIENLPSDWKALPPPNSTKDIGTEWVKRGKSAVLRVPSIIISSEYNLVLNPKHNDFVKIRIGKPQPFLLDDRMWK